MNFFFFDLDGTLEDSREDMVAAAQFVRKSLGLSFRDFQTLVPHVNRGMRELYLNCFDDFVVETGAQTIDENKLNQIQKLYEERYGEQIAERTQLYPGIREVLADARQRGRVAVITNKPEHLSVRLLKALDVDQWVDLVVGGDTCSEAKPSPVPLRFALERLGGQVTKDQVFMIGDSQGDARAGALFGATTIWCGWGYQAHQPTDPAPEKSFATPQDLGAFLKRLEA